jgi:hypothetical protein
MKMINDFLDWRVEKKVDELVKSFEYPELA